MENAVTGVVEQISDVKGDVAKVMGMFPSMPSLPEGSFLGLPIKFFDPTSMLFATTPSIENGPVENSDASTAEQVPGSEGEPSAEPPSEENKTHHHPPPLPSNDAPPPPPSDGPKPPASRVPHSLY